MSRHPLDSAPLVLAGAAAVLEMDEEQAERWCRRLVVRLLALADINDVNLCTLSNWLPQNDQMNSLMRASALVRRCGGFYALRLAWSLVHEPGDAIKRCKAPDRTLLEQSAPWVRVAYAIATAGSAWSFEGDD